MILSLALERETAKPADQVHSGRVGKFERAVVWWLIKSRLFFLACLTLKSPARILKTFRTWISLREKVWAGDLKKLYRIGGRYYFNQYTPGWPSRAYDEMIRKELIRKAFPEQNQSTLSFVFLAMTRKCPMRCEHCFEWDNLNQRETFTLDLLFRTVDFIQQQGALQIHFTGGEPLVRFKDLVEVLRYASKKSECWVLTSGFGLDEAKSRQLKAAGCRGVAISLDHHHADRHNAFRGHAGAFVAATSAVAAARQAGLVVTLSVCATRTFIEQGNMMPYLVTAKEMGVNFVQVLEPKNTGKYADKDVLLDEAHTDTLSQIFSRVNHDPDFDGYPTMIYHGYHQRKVGCFSGSRSIYIDSAGNVHACPFCHTASYNVIDYLEQRSPFMVKENKCPRYSDVA